MTAAIDRSQVEAWGVPAIAVQFLKCSEHVIDDVHSGDPNVAELKEEFEDDYPCKIFWFVRADVYAVVLAERDAYLACLEGAGYPTPNEIAAGGVDFARAVGREVKAATERIVARAEAAEAKLAYYKRLHEVRDEMKLDSNKEG